MSDRPVICADAEEALRTWARVGPWATRACVAGVELLIRLGLVYDGASWIVPVGDRPEPRTFPRPEVTVWLDREELAAAKGAAELGWADRWSGHYDEFEAVYEVALSLIYPDRPVDLGSICADPGIGPDTLRLIVSAIAAAAGLDQDD